MPGRPAFISAAGKPLRRSNPKLSRIEDKNVPFKESLAGSSKIEYAGFV
jgi:hypothetical protein